MFERNYRIESMKRDQDTNYWVANISYYSGILGFEKKYNKAMLINDTWVDCANMQNINRYHPIVSALNNMWHCKMKMEQNNVEA